LLSPLLSRLIRGYVRVFKQPKGVSGKTSASKHKFVIDFSRPAGDGVFDGADFEKYLHDRIKVEGKAGQLGDNVKITRDGMLS
jgi:large subunit ribosomal protein L22e